MENLKDKGYGAKKIVINMTSDIKFSVTVPAYKAQFLGECIDSILAQTYKNFEVIIVNDASPQDLDSIVKRYDDPRIHYYKNKVGFGAEHVVGNWNKCLEYATGDYVICMGDDDKLLPHCLEEYVKLIEKYPGVGLLHGWTEIIDEDSTPFLMTTHRCEYESAISLCWHRWFGGYNLQFIGDFCFEREWLQRNGGFFDLPLAWSSDEISALIGASKNGVANTQSVVFQYRRNRYTISNNGNIEKKLKAISGERKWYGAFLSQIPKDDMDKLYRAEILSRMNNHFQKKIGMNISGSLKSQGRCTIVKWFLNRNKYGITNKSLIFALLQSFK